MIDEGEYQAYGKRWAVKVTQIVECPLELLREAEIRLGHTPLIGLSVEKNRFWSLYFVIASLKKNGMGLFSVLMMDQCLSVETLNLMLVL
jgi:hypothetical protein